jgi:phosphoribosyl-AMP cyclohydrolase / phosphoribosyl-ATP pyrophosphohydrolase
MQAYADKAAISETLQTGYGHAHASSHRGFNVTPDACWQARRLGTFFSRSRKGRWCKGETSGHYLKVQKVFADCDRDSIIYLSDPIGPSCHTGARQAALPHAMPTDPLLH